MKCPNCGTENVPDARYCLHCGQKLTSELTCPNCHAVVQPGATFCSQCGQPLAPAAQPAEGISLVAAPAAAPAPEAAPAPTAAHAPVDAQAQTDTQTPPVAPPPVPEGARQEPGTGRIPGAQPPAGFVSSVVQTIVGDNNIQVNVSNINGSDVNLTIKPTERPRALPQPLELRPQAFPNLLDRQDELLEVAQSLEQRAPVEISGEAGEGRTSLMRAVGNSPSADLKRFAGGVVYHRALGQPVTDLLQSLFALFYQLPKDYKPSPEEIHRGLHDLQALFLLDDVSLTGDQVTDLRSQAPNATFVLVTTERTLQGEGRALALGGLPTEAALALIERELSRPLAPQERTAASQVCASLKGNPDRLLKTAARVRKGQTFESILQSMAQIPLNPILLSGLTTPEMRVLSVVALGRGAPVPLEHIALLADLPDATPVLQDLQQRRLVQSHSPSYSLTGALAQELWRDWDLSQWAKRALDYFIQWAEARQDEPRSIFDSIDVILSLLEWAVGQKDWAQVLRLGRAIQAALALSLRWGAWLQVLTWILTAARALGERAVEGWALHQIGTHALCVSDHQVARSFLTQALTLRQSIGDKAGAAVTQHNLNLLLGPLAPPSQGKPPTTKGPTSTLASVGGVLKWILPLLGVTVLVVAAVVIGIWHPWVQWMSTPTQTPLPAGKPPPDIVFSLEGGCNRPYPPGSGQVFTYNPNQDGWVTVMLDGEALPDQNRRQVSGGVQYEGKILIPRLPGEHVLSAVFDTGISTIRRECPFTGQQGVTSNPPTIQEITLVPQLPCENNMVQATVRVMDDAGIDTVELHYQNPNTQETSLAPGQRVDDYTYQFTFFASFKAGTPFYIYARDKNGNSISTQDKLNMAWSGFTESGIDKEQYCVAFLILPQVDLSGNDLPRMPLDIASYNECMVQCSHNLTCQAFTQDGSTKGCWLKNPVPVAAPKDVCTSGIKSIVRIP